MNVAVRIGAEELLGLRVAWSAVASRLNAFSLKRIFEVLTQLGLALDNVDRHEQQAPTQGAICSLLFGPIDGPAIWAKARAWTDVDQIPRNVVLVDELLLSVAAKAALLCVPSTRADSGYSLGLLGEALLMLNTLTAGERTESSPRDTEKKREVEYFEYVALAQFGRQVPLHAFARNWDLYLSGNPTLAGSKNWMDLRAVIQSVAGVTVEDAFSAMLLFSQPWLFPGPESPAPLHGMLPKSFFRQWRSLGPVELDQLLSTLVQPVETACKSTAHAFSRQRLRPFHNLPLAIAPLIDFGDAVGCVSTKLLMDRIQKGWHHIILSAAPRVSKESTRYLNFMGDVFEDYCDRMFRRMYPPSIAAIDRYIGPREIEAKIEGPKCDMIVEHGETLLLVECKAKQMPLAAISGESRETFERAWRETFIDGAARQLDGTVKAIKRGALRALGVHPERVRQYIPVACTLDVTSLGPMLHHRLWEVTRETGRLQDVEVSPMQVLTIAELEMLELHEALGGGTACDLFIAKIRDAALRAFPVRTATVRLKSPVVSRDKNQYLVGVFDKRMEHLRGFLARRG